MKTAVGPKFSLLLQVAKAKWEQLTLTWASFGHIL